MQLYLSLPLSGSYVHIYFSGSRVLLQADAGSLVSYDWCHHIFVMVSKTYSGAL